MRFPAKLYPNQEALSVWHAVPNRTDALVLRACQVSCRTGPHVLRHVQLYSGVADVADLHSRLLRLGTVIPGELAFSVNSFAVFRAGVAFCSSAIESRGSHLRPSCRASRSRRNRESPNFGLPFSPYSSCRHSRKSPVLPNLRASLTLAQQRRRQGAGTNDSNRPKLARKVPRSRAGLSRDSLRGSTRKGTMTMRSLAREPSAPESNTGATASKSLGISFGPAISQQHASPSSSSIAADS